MSDTVDARPSVTTVEPPRPSLPSGAPPTTRPSAYDRYVDYKFFSIAVGVFLLLLLVPTPSSMVDVAVEYSVGEERVLEFYASEMFGRPLHDTEQWQAFTARVLERNMRQGILKKEPVLSRDARAIRQMGLTVEPRHFERYKAYVEGLDEAQFQSLMSEAKTLRTDTLTYEDLTAAERVRADRWARNMKIVLALVGFVIVCFVTEAMPLPGVAFCIGLILVFGGIVTRAEVASLYWSDACWFIMGSLMFATAFVKTGVDKRVCLMLFRSLAKPNVKWITAILIVVIAPAASFISDHALAAMFLPIGIILYSNSLNHKVPIDMELAKMLIITICMACNIGGFGSPSGGARNVILMTYLEDMFGYTMSYGQWILYGMPFVILMIPVVWVMVNWRFKPQITDLGPALETLKRDIDRMGGWNRTQIITLAIFLAMFLGWITESNYLADLIGVRLGIGVIAVAGAVAYLLAGVVNWRDYQTKVDWGVVWLYAGAIIFGKVLDGSGTAYWLARSLVEGMASLGFSSGQALLAAGGIVTAFMTQIMADGPAAAAVGPITLNMAGVVAPGTVLIPFMALITAGSSSLAYLLIIGTPPNAIVYASGYLAPRDFLRVGIPCLIAALALMLFLSAFLWPLIGFPGLAPM
jgi:solute carrier family 13 (sodium-dependent dicarboxylate transporter), member 2/3/5